MKYLNLFAALAAVAMISTSALAVQNTYGNGSANGGNEAGSSLSCRQGSGSGSGSGYDHASGPNGVGQGNCAGACVSCDGDALQDRTRARDGSCGGDGTRKDRNRVGRV